jgi:hypothetical protein
MALNLEKKQELVRLCLEKRKVPTDIRLAVKLALDVSGSARPLYRNGTMQELVDRLIPVGMRFDDNKSIESYAFGSTIEQVGDITPDDFGSYVDTKFLREAGAVLWSGTQYATALSRILKDTNGKTGFLGGLFGSKKKAPTPSYLMFITDGETQGDEAATERLLSDYRGSNVYVQLIGVGRANFSFLENMADMFSNVGFVTFPDLEQTSDEAMYEALLGEELCGWIKGR